MRFADGSRKAAIHAAGFFTYPGFSVITTFHGFTDQIIEAAGLVFGIFAITGKLNDAAPRANSGALLIGLLVAMIGASMRNLEAWAINPARDFGPRVFAGLADWGRPRFHRP